MFTEQSLRDNPSLVKAFMGITSEQFWELNQQMNATFKHHLHEQRQQAPRQRAVGAGRPNDLPLAIRTALVLTYLRLHIPQASVAALFGATQSDVSRELRRLGPLIGEHLPCPVVWDVQQEAAPVAHPQQLTLSDIAEAHILIDATEQVVARPQDTIRQKAYYSGKKKGFTLKTQLASDTAHHVHAISVAVGGAEHDKALSDRLDTLSHLPDDCQVDADKGYQGLANQVDTCTITDPVSGVSQVRMRLTVNTPFKKPKGGERSVEQKAWNEARSAVRIRVEHCIGWAKNWAILATRFRCSHTIYTPIVQLIFGFVNAQTQRWQVAKASLCINSSVPGLGGRKKSVSFKTIK